MVTNTQKDNNKAPTNTFRTISQYLESVFRELFSGDKGSNYYIAFNASLTAIFLSYIPILFFIVYMHFHQFFSYEFFSEGVFGLNVFFFVTVYYLIMASFMFFWWLLPIVDWCSKSKRCAKERDNESEPFKTGFFIYTFVLSLIFAILFWLSHEWRCVSIDWQKTQFIGLIALLIMVHISFVFYMPPKSSMITLVLLIGLVTGLSVLSPEATSKVMKGTLRNYGVGGEKEVTLVPKVQNDNDLKGKLMLLSPKHIYIKLEGSDDISTINRSAFKLMTMKTRDRELRKECGKE